MQNQARKPGNASNLLTLLVAMLAFSMLIHTEQIVINASSGRAIDVFTQKAPFDGKGANQSSDAFEPQELAILYALVTYNDYPVALKLVSFQVNGPPNNLENTTITGSATTSDSGIAEFPFRIPWPSNNPEMKVLGEWHVVATASIADQTVADTLTFQIAWIIRITNIATLNTSFQPQHEFPRHGQIVFDVVVDNIANMEEVATIAIDALDLLQQPIIHIQKENLLFQPGQTHINASSQIPADAMIGQATAWACAYTMPVEQGGVPYSPAAHTTFEIISSGPGFSRDVAIADVIPSQTEVSRGQTVQITVTAKNKGDETESFNVTVCYDSVTIGTKRVSSLSPEAEMQLIFSWNTSNVNPGRYVIKATADTVEEETNIEDNTFVDGIVTVKGPVIFGLELAMIFGLMMMFLIGASLLLLCLLWHSLKHRRQRRRPTSYYMIAAHIHI